MIAKPIAFTQIPNQAMFGLAAAARHLGKHKNTVRKLVDLGIIKARVELDLSARKRRVFTLEVLNAYIDSLATWSDLPNGEESGAELPDSLAGETGCKDDATTYVQEQSIY